MDRLIYTAVSGMADSMIRQGAIASNLANANTIGFRAETFDSTPVSVRSRDTVDVRTMVSTGVLGAQMTAGSTIETGRGLDIAISGQALLTVQAQDGSEAYTRRGDLSVLANGTLVNGDGLPVVGSAGPITVPPGGTVSIAPDGSVLVADPATPDAPPQIVDRLKLASWEGSPIAKGLDGLFRVRDGGVLPADEEARVQSGVLEQSNVDVTSVLVQMVEAQRLFDMRTKLVATAREIDESGANLMRMS
ncbi:MAG: flagellar biosynthesis protein FlgF [Sphingomonadales bacterium 32-68-7]|nr:MAG: flagellar biosynthesis protein FlgF [Sphingomonadales bacterium 12-68-11]OYX10150.1 MAG: flagellar biosynthesis protein FlgF [Sphingomonadales bacterium 32-68-7]